MVNTVHTPKIMTDDDGSVIARIRTLTCKDPAAGSKIMTDDRFSPIPAYRAYVYARAHTCAHECLSMGRKLSSVMIMVGVGSC